MEMTHDGLLDQCLAFNKPPLSTLECHYSNLIISGQVYSAQISYQKRLQWTLKLWASLFEWSDLWQQVIKIINLCKTLNSELCVVEGGGWWDGFLLFPVHLIRYLAAVFTTSNYLGRVESLILPTLSFLAYSELSSQLRFQFLSVFFVQNGGNVWLWN